MNGRPPASHQRINDANHGGDPMSKKILIVEDTDDNRRILRDLLGTGGYDVIEAQDGAEGSPRRANTGQT